MLPTRVVDLPLTGGYDQAKDAVAVQAGSFIKLENLEYDAQGALWKRHGSVAMPRATFDNVGTLPAIDHVDTLGGELLAFANRPLGGGDTKLEPGPYLWSWSSQAAAWSPRSSVTPCTLTRRPVLRSSLPLISAQPFVSVVNNIEVWVWRGPESSGFRSTDYTLYYRVTDLTTGAILVDDKSLGFDTQRFVSFACGDDVVIVWYDVDVTNFRDIRYNASSLTLSAAVSVLATGGSGVERWDAAPIDSGHYAVFYSENGGSPVFNLDRIAVGSGSTHNVFLGAENPTVMAVFSDGSHVGIAYDLSDGIYVRTYTAAALVAAVAEIRAWDSTDTSLMPLIWSVVGCFDYLGRAWVASDAYQTIAPIKDGLVVAAIDTDGSVYSSARVLYHAAVMSRPWASGSSVYLLSGASTENDADRELATQWGAAVLNLSAHHDNAGRLIHLAAATPALDIFWMVANFAESRPFPFVVSPSSLEYTGALSLYGQGGTARFYDALSLSFNVPVSGLWRSASAQGALCLSGGLTSWYDSYSATELGFVQRPLRSGSFVLTGPAVTVAANVYGYVAVYAWRDGKGNLHFSEPSEVYTVTSTQGAIDGDAGSPVYVTFAIRTATLTRKGDTDDGASRLPMIWVYRTAANAPETYYLLDTASTENDPFTYSHTFTDGETDADLIDAARGILYTSGGILENRPPPPFSAVIQHKGRIWGASANDDREVFYSKLLVSGEGPGFNEAFRLRIDDSPDGIIALAPLDDKVIVFTRRRIYAITGDGPNDKGSDGGFGGPFLVTSSAGCLDARSVVPWSGGVFFQSVEGLCLLDRGLGVTYAGSPVQGLTDEYSQITGGLLDAAKQRCMWLLSDGSHGITLFFDYNRGAWLTWNHGAALESQRGHAVLDGDYIRVDSSGLPYTSSGEVGLDGDQWFTLRLKTPHLRPDALGGAERVRRVIVSGQKLRNRSMVGRAYFDQATDPDQELTLSETQFAGNGTHRFIMHLSRQKGSSMAFELEDSAPAIAPESSVRCRIFGIAFEVGVLPGVARLSSGDRR